MPVKIHNRPIVFLDVIAILGEPNNPKWSINMPIRIWPNIPISVVNAAPIWGIKIMLAVTKAIPSIPPVK